MSHEIIQESLIFLPVSLPSGCDVSFCRVGQLSFQPLHSEMGKESTEDQGKWDAPQ